MWRPSLPKLVDMVLANEIEDGKTQIMILKPKLLKDMGNCKTDKEGFPV